MNSAHAHPGATLVAGQPYPMKDPQNRGTTLGINPVMQRTGRESACCLICHQTVIPWDGVQTGHPPTGEGAPPPEKTRSRRRRCAGNRLLGARGRTRQSVGPAALTPAAVGGPSGWPQRLDRSGPASYRLGIMSTDRPQVSAIRITGPVPAGAPGDRRCSAEQRDRKLEWPALQGQENVRRSTR